MTIIKPISKIALLLFGLIPIVFLIFGSITLDPGVKTKSLLYIIPFFLTVVSIPTVFIFYIINVYTNKRVIEDKKHLWAALLFFGNVLAYPFYWYKHIW